MASCIPVSAAHEGSQALTCAVVGSTHAAAQGAPAAAAHSGPTAVGGAYRRCIGTVAKSTTIHSWYNNNNISMWGSRLPLRGWA